MTYPDSWPSASRGRPDSVASRITEQQKNDLYHRRITTRALAKILGVNESYLSDLFPGKEAPVAKNKKIQYAALFAVRREYRALQASRVIAKELTVDEAATACRISYRSMARAVQMARMTLKEAANVGQPS